LRIGAAQPDAAGLLGSWRCRPTGQSRHPDQAGLIAEQRRHLVARQSGRPARVVPQALHQATGNRIVQVDAGRSADPHLLARRLDQTGNRALVGNVQRVIEEHALARRRIDDRQVALLRADPDAPVRGLEQGLHDAPGEGWRYRRRCWKTGSKRSLPAGRATAQAGPGAHPQRSLAVDSSACTRSSGRLPACCVNVGSGRRCRFSGEVFQPASLATCPDAAVEILGQGANGRLATALFIVLFTLSPRQAVTFSVAGS
jgi:hypothetical protein